MDSKIFHFSSPIIAPHIIDSFTGTPQEKTRILKMIDEWNSHVSISQLCNCWKKERPSIVKQNLSIILYNVESLNTHVADVDILLSCYKPHVCILTGIGIAIKKKNISFPNYLSFSQIGTNSFGGVMILYHASINCKIIDRDLNFILIEISTANHPIYVGGLYVPPRSLPLPFNCYPNTKIKVFIFLVTLMLNILSGDVKRIIQAECIFLIG